MEDIRTSEALEKEILEDARKKAERILKNAEKEIEKLRAEWNTKKEAELAALDAEAAARKALRKKEMEAVFPLEIQRRKLKFMNEAFENFLREFFAKLPADDLALLLSERGKKFSAFFSGRKNESVTVLYAGLPPEAARGIASPLLGNSPPALSEGEGFRGLVFCAGGGAYRYRLTTDEIENELREYHRQAIMGALRKEAV